MYDRMIIPVNVSQSDTWNCIEHSCLEVLLVEIHVHIETSGAEVISS